MSAENSERKFLHDISSPLGTALLLSDSLAETVQPGTALTEESVDQIKTVLHELERVRTIIQKRREFLIESEKASPAK